MAHTKKIVDHNKLQKPLFRKADHIPATERPNTEAAKQAARYTDPRIDILMFKRPAPDNSHYLVVKFYSHVKPNWLLLGEVEMKGKSERDIDFEVGVICGAMAERLDELYGDNFDPDRSARDGSKKWGELIREIERQSTKR
jgi:hypothetical protein